MIEHPAGEHGFTRFLDPLIDERADFVPKICSVI
jgi:hypothetical protein